MAVYQLDSLILDVTGNDGLWNAFRQGLQSGPFKPRAGGHVASVPSNRLQGFTDQDAVLRVLRGTQPDVGGPVQTKRVEVNGNGCAGRLLVCLVTAEQLLAALEEFDWGAVRSEGVGVVVLVSLGDSIDRSALKCLATPCPVDCVVVHAGTRDKNGASRYDLPQVAERVGQALHCIVVREHDSPTADWPLVTGRHFRDIYRGGVRHCCLGLQVVEFNPEEYAREVVGRHVVGLPSHSRCTQHQADEDCAIFGRDRAVALAKELRDDLHAILKLNKQKQGEFLHAGLQFGGQVCLGVVGAAPSTPAEGRSAHQNWRQSVQFAYEYDRDLRAKRLIDVLRSAGKWQSAALPKVAEQLRDVISHVAAPHEGLARFGATPALLRGVVREFSQVLDEELSAAVVPEPARDKEWEVVRKSTVADDLDLLSKELERWPNKWTVISQGLLACALVAAVLTGCWTSGSLSGLACVAVLVGSALVSLWVVQSCLSSAAARRESAWRTIVRNSERRLELLLASEVQGRINETRDLARAMSVRAEEAGKLLSEACQRLCHEMPQPSSGHADRPWMFVWPGRESNMGSGPQADEVGKMAKLLRGSTLTQLASMIERPVDWTLDGICEALAEPLCTVWRRRAEAELREDLRQKCAAGERDFWSRGDRGEDILWPAESDELRQGTGEPLRGPNLRTFEPDGWRAQVCVWDIRVPCATGGGGR